MKLKVLIIEDDAVTTLLVESLLKGAGHDSRAAKDTDSANRLIAAESFDALISDWSVPGSLTGKELAEKFVALNPNAPIIFITGHALDSLPTFDGNLKQVILRQKPVDYDVILNELEGLVINKAN